MRDFRIGPPPTFPYPCTAAYGEDEHGIWQSMVVNDVVQSFRWCPPGAFIMGSEKDEPGRFPEEMHREVTLKSGFWLADTTCTQKLWAALMEDHPSRYQGDLLPVESVSYENVLEFLARWRDLVPLFPLRLPTGTEWEFACRAGTQTPFWFGETISIDQVNFNGQYRYRKHEPKQVRRGKTVPVKALPCNSWGLFQMHGNVHELCSHGLLDKQGHELVLPVEPDEGDFRVVRGGSYFDTAQACRSAYCVQVRLNDARDNLGFRPAADG